MVKRIGVGIKSVLQKGEGNATTSVPVMVMTHRAEEKNVREALKRIDELPDVTAPTLMLRIGEGV